MDTIFIRGIAVEAIIGIYEHERVNRQPVIVDLELDTDISAAVQSERVEDALDYESLTNSVEEFIKSSDFQLIETLSEQLAQHILDHSKALAVRLTLHKPNALSNARDVGLVISRPQTNQPLHSQTQSV
ncbi:MAG: dihydroneopterin aldolase [Gammaproteobacteria bacterium]|nr:dihydroneopterin aldolase [Gammaproteobacteria bacterium]